MTYFEIHNTRSKGFFDDLPARVQERRVLQFCVVLVLSALLFFVFVPAAGAQDVFTSKQLPTVGVQYNLRQATDKNVDPQPEGQSQFWDFGSLIPDPKFTDTVSMISPLGQPGTLPGTSVIVRHTSSNRRLFYGIDTKQTSLNYLGESTTQQQIVVGSNPFDIEPIPIKYNDVVSRQYNATITFPLLPTRSMRRGGSFSLRADGIGILLLPGSANIVDVVRVHWTEQSDDTLFINNKAQYVAHSATERYVWYGANDPSEYLSIRKGNVTFTRISLSPPPDSLIDEVLYLNGTPTSSGVDSQPDESLQVFPQPAHSVVHINSTTHTVGRLRAELYSLDGELLSSVQASGDDDHSLSINIAALSAQSAVLKVYDGSHVFVRKVIISR